MISRQTYTPRACTTTVRLAPPTTQTTILSDEELETLLRHPDDSSIQIYGKSNNYKLKEVRVVEHGLEVGYKSSLSEHELATCYGPDGVITNNIFNSMKKVDRSENKTERVKKPMQVGVIIYEPSRYVGCRAHKCEAMGLVMRFNHVPSNTRGVLFYERVNHHTLPVPHTNHDLFPIEIKRLQKGEDITSADVKATLYSLSYQQKQALFKKFKNTNPTKEDIKVFVEKWKDLPDSMLRTSKDQDNYANKLITKAVEFVKNAKKSCKKKSDAHWYFSAKKDSSKASQAQLKHFLDILSTDEGSSERTRKYKVSDDDYFPYLGTTEFRICLERIKITEHDCDGETWTV